MGDTGEVPIPGNQADRQYRPRLRRDDGAAPSGYDRHAQEELHYGREVQSRRIAQEIIVDQIEQISLMGVAVEKPLPASVSSPTDPLPTTQAGPGFPLPRLLALTPRPRPCPPPNPPSPPTRFLCALWGAFMRLGPGRVQLERFPVTRPIDPRSLKIPSRDVF